MYRIHRNTDMGESLQQWKGMAWNVMLHLNSRQSVSSIAVVCVRQFDDGGVVEGFSSMNVAPFDNLRAVIQDLLLQAALDTQDHPSHLEVELPFGAA